jgi:hypothetical protein
MDRRRQRPLPEPVGGVQQRPDPGQHADQPGAGHCDRQLPALHDRGQLHQERPHVRDDRRNPVPESCDPGARPLHTDTRRPLRRHTFDRAHGPEQHGGDRCADRSDVRHPGCGPLGGRGQRSDRRESQGLQQPDQVRQHCDERHAVLQHRQHADRGVRHLRLQPVLLRRRDQGQVGFGPIRCRAAPAALQRAFRHSLVSG